MKTVTLFRHAKSGEKDNPHIEDFDRPLSDRGLKAAPKLGAAMREHHLRPNLIICSAAVRTRQTLALAAAQAWDNPPKIRFDARLYEASAQTLLKVLKDVS
jgi:phosphohistidine phosphatase